MRILLISLFITTQAFAYIKFDRDCETEVVNLINESTNNIDIVVYGINNDKIIQSIIQAKDRGVKIQFLTDRLQAFGNSSKANFLYQNGLNIKLHSKYKITHHKFAIFDNKKAIQGSFNWTNPASEKNAEDCNVFTIKQDIDTLQERFDYLWSINKKDISDCYFENIKTNKADRKKCISESRKYQ